MFKTKQHSRRSALRASLAAGTLLATGAALSAGCLDRPVTEQKPTTSNVFVDQIVNTKVDKIDLLFVIDNSVSMSDKQEVLRQAVPVLVERLVNPSCKHRETGELVEFTGSDCPEGYSQEFDPINNIHIGVVTSSLGGHGGGYCSGGGDANDRAELLVHVRPGLPVHDPAGFLQWRGSEGTQSKDDFIQDFTAHVMGAGETGCGFEATLEAWYRFLIDPEPPVDMAVDSAEEPAYPVGNALTSEGVPYNENLIQQRAAFLRPDSLVAIIMLSDENDCSIRDGGFNWIVSEVDNSARMWAASEACDENPNDECCYTCGLEQPPGNCGPSARCQENRQSTDDDPNLRCFDQKRRFGVDFLYPASRYIQGLTEMEVPRRSDGEMVPNPLFQAPEGIAPRDRSLVFLAGIIGVPWQDIATEESLADPNKLVFLTAEELKAENRWDVILGDPQASPPIPPTDPLMRESIEPRTGANPITGDELVTWQTPRGNPINGHEYNIPGRNDLQYACTFPLSEPLLAEECGAEGKPAGACDCISQPDAEAQKPLCFPSNGGAFGNTQYFAKAYPGIRFLEVLKGFGNNSIVASICPKHPVGNDPTNPNVGYNPAVGAIVERLSEALKGSCLPRQLDVDEETGDVPCSVVEVVGVNQPHAVGCGLAGRSEPEPKVIEAVQKKLREGKYCPDGDCSAWQICTVNPVPKEERDICLYDVDARNSAPTPGYCYIDPSTGQSSTGAQGDGCSPDAPESCSNPNVETCPATSRRLLRLVGHPGAETPAPGSTTFVACVGSAL